MFRLVIFEKFKIMSFEVKKIQKYHKNRNSYCFVFVLFLVLGCVHEEATDQRLTNVDRVGFGHHFHVVSIANLSQLFAYVHG